MTYSAHQLDLLAGIHMSDSPVIEACETLRRWDYIGLVARAAKVGICLDTELGAVKNDPDYYINRSVESCTVLREYLQGVQQLDNQRI